VCLVALAGAALAMLGRARDLTWWLIGAAFLMFAAADWVYAEQLAHGDYVVGGPLELGFQLPRLALLGAALTSLRSHPAPITLDGVRMLAVPGACALAVLGVLFHATKTPLPGVATGLAFTAGIAVVGRTALTIREVRTLAEVTRQALTDDLTGLSNRRFFYDALRRTVDEAQYRACAVLLVDLDRFKEVNDSFGHHAGDDLLRQVGHRLARTVGLEGVLARLGGDEYAVLVEGGDLAHAQRMASQIKRVLRPAFHLGPANVVMTGSIGIALAPLHTQNSEQLLQMADLAMYAAKADGRGVQVYDEDRDGPSRHRLERISELREAGHAHQLVLHYQPQVTLQTQSVSGVEALVRWQHPVHGMLGPHQFLHLAESAGLMTGLTEWVVHEALKQCRAWRDAGLKLRVAVNVSPSVLVDRGFPSQIKQALADHALPANALALEVTEELLMDNQERTIQAMQELRRLGVRMSIDDYGTGYSSLAYLKDLPVTELKLDRSFVASMGSSAGSTAIVHSTIDLAHALGLDIVAEGVEDVATLDALAAAGCDLAQGYLFSHPVPAPAIAQAFTRATAVASPTH
jgi:diguanylate cyclase